MSLCLCGVLSSAIATHAQGDAKSQSDRAAARIKALQAESDRLAAQARTVFGDLRKLEIDREIRQQKVVKTELELARVTTARDEIAGKLKALEQLRVAQTPAVPS